MRQFLLLCLLTTGVTLLAQPTVNPDTRDVLGIDLPVNFYSELTAGPGPEGANQTWDFSGLGAPDLSYAWEPLPAAETRFIDSFPQANLAVRVPAELIGRDSAEAFFYYDVRDDGQLLFYGYGAEIPDSSFATGRDTFFIIYDDPALDAAFPVTFNDVFTDDWSQITSLESDTLSFTTYRRGERTLTADGYGTLITPAGTFENALRIRREETVYDSTVIPGLPVTVPAGISQINVFWDWYAPGEEYLLMQITESRLFTGGVEVLSTRSGFYRNRGPGTSTTYLNPEAWKLTAAPNPATDRLQLRFVLPDAGPVSVQLVSFQGKILRETTHRHLPAGANQLSVDVVGLPAGMYVALLQLPGGSTRLPFLISK